MIEGGPLVEVVSPPEEVSDKSLEVSKLTKKMRIPEKIKISCQKIKNIPPKISFDQGRSLDLGGKKRLDSKYSLGKGKKIPG